MQLQLILASASPRRHTLLHQLGLAFEVIPSNFDESIPPGISPNQLVEHLARSKARSVAVSRPRDLVLGADTIVVLDNEILNKPSNREDAVGMLRRLCGRTHRVMTGVALIGGGTELVAHEVTAVSFLPAKPEQIERYVDSGEPMDKAGAYGIQGRWSAMVSGIEGDYFNVVGLPLSRTAHMLAHFGVLVL